MIIQILISLFVLFAISRVWLRYNDGSISLVGTFVWSILWIGLGVVVWEPNITTTLASMIGVGRGVDALVYLSIVVLFYGLFRVYVKMEFLEHEITSLVRNKALREAQRNTHES